MLFFRKKKRYSGEVVDLVESYVVEASLLNDYTKSIVFNIVLKDNTVIGNCDIRLGNSNELYYAGNIGYSIRENYRGNNYAYYASLILIDIGKKYGLNKLYITCSPDNIASFKTIEKLGATFIERCDVPSNHWLYRRGEKVKDIFVLNI